MLYSEIKHCSRIKQTKNDITERKPFNYPQLLNGRFTGKKQTVAPLSLVYLLFTLLYACIYLFLEATWNNG